MSVIMLSIGHMCKTELPQKKKGNKLFDAIFQSLPRFVILADTLLLEPNGVYEVLSFEHQFCSLLKIFTYGLILCHSGLCSLGCHGFTPFLW